MLAKELKVGQKFMFKLYRSDWEDGRIRRAMEIDSNGYVKYSKECFTGWESTCGCNCEVEVVL